jgi:pimeloyl-ACP methyl ester carboxylesterase
LDSLSPDLAAWKARGRALRVFGHEVFVLSEGSGPTLLLLHGFPTYSIDFRRVLPLLARGHRVVVHDHVGFGLSDKPERWSYSLVEQAEVAIAVWRALGVTRGHLVAHDMGTSIATELLARRERGLLPVELASVTLSNGSVHIEMSRLTPSQKILRSRLGPLFAKVASRRVFKAQIRRILGDRASVEDRELDLLWEGMVRAGGRAALPKLIGYVAERARFRDRWIGPLERLDLPSHLLWGRRDPVAIAPIAERLAREIPHARLTWLDELGHFPMLESPARFGEALLAFVDEVERKKA